MKTHFLKKEDSLPLSPIKNNISPSNKNSTKILYLNSYTRDFTKKNYELLPNVINLNKKKNFCNFEENISIIPLVLPKNNIKSNSRKNNKRLNVV